MLRRAILSFIALWLAAGSASSSTQPPRWQTLPPPVALPKATTAGYLVHDGARIFFRTYGHGEPILLLHGGLANSEYWGNQVPALSRAGYRAILIDSRGHGRSSRDERPYTYELMASDVAAVMDALKIRRAAVVGWSDGAIIGLVMALKMPTRVTRVFAFAANMDPSGVNPTVTSNPTFARFGDEAGKAYARLSPTPHQFVAFHTAISRMWDTEPNYKAADLARIATPTAIVDGEHDEAVLRSHTEYLARTIPGAELMILPNVSHFAMLQDPQMFNRRMLSFLRKR